MDPSATTSAAGGHGHGHGHLITATRRRLLAPCPSSSRPASDQKVDPLDSTSVSVSFASASASASDPDPGPGPDPDPGSEPNPLSDPAPPAPEAKAKALSYRDLDLSFHGHTTAALGSDLDGTPFLSRLSGDASASSTTSAPLPPTSSLSCFSSTPTPTALAARHDAPSLSPPCLETLPSELLTLVVGFLDVNDVFHLSRTCHRLRSLCLDPIIHLYRLRDARLALGSLLSSPSRPSLGDLIARYIFQTNNTVISRRLARSLVSIRLSRRLAQRPSAESLAQRAVLPCECVPGMGPVLVAPALVAKRKAIEKERLKDGLRRWIASKWKGQVKKREEDARRYDEAHGVGRVWRLRRFWEKVSRGEMAAR